MNTLESTFEAQTKKMGMFEALMKKMSTHVWSTAEDDEHVWSTDEDDKHVWSTDEDEDDEHVWSTEKMNTLFSLLYFLFSIQLPFLKTMNTFERQRRWTRFFLFFIFYSPFNYRFCRLRLMWAGSVRTVTLLFHLQLLYPSD
jgi:hypothetical protein